MILKNSIAVLIAIAMTLQTIPVMAAEEHEEEPDPVQNEVSLIAEAKADEAGEEEDIEEEEPEVFSDEDYEQFRHDDYYSAEYSIPTGAEIRERFLLSCLSRADLKDGHFISSALFVSTCARDSGLSDACSLPLTPNADELYDSICAIRNAVPRGLREMLQTAGYGSSQLTGSLIFLTQGVDADYRDEMSREYDERLSESTEAVDEGTEAFLQYPYHKKICYREVGICVGEGPGYVLVAGLDGNMCPSVKLLTAAECGPDARMVLFLYEGLVEQLADHIALLTNLNDVAIAGIISNMYYESGLNPDSYGDKDTSYGLCQWHNGRKDKLLRLCTEKGLNPSEMKSQVIYLAEELRTEYPETLNYLRELEDSPEGAYYAASRFCLWYECPCDADDKAGFRGGAAERMFYGIVTNRAG